MHKVRYFLFPSPAAVCFCLTMQIGVVEIRGGKKKAKAAADINLNKIGGN